MTDYEGTDAFTLAENPEPDVRRLRELQGNSGGNGKGNPQGGPHKNAAFEAEDGQIFELTDLAEGDDDLPSGIQVTLPVTASANAQGKISLHGAKIEKGPNANANSKAFENTSRRLATVTGDKTVVGVRVVTSCGESTTTDQNAPEAESKEVMEAVMIASKEATGPRSLIGQRVSVEEKGVPSFGTVAGYDDKTRFWTVLFDDQEQEEGELNRVELASAFKSYSKHLADSLKAMWKAGEI